VGAGEKKFRDVPMGPEKEENSKLEISGIPLQAKEEAWAGG